MDKICKKCEIPKATSEFRSGNTCILCVRQHHRMLYQLNKEDRKLKTKNRYNLKREEIMQIKKDKYLQNLDKNREERRRSYYENRDKRLIKAAEYRKNHRELINEKRRNTTFRYELTPQSKIKRSYYNRINKLFRYNNIRKQERSILFLGCTFTYLKQHLESKFLPTMTWQNYGKYWHIDHIKPCDSFDLTIQEQQKECFHYTNLQPLFAVTQIIDGVEYIGNLNKNNKNTGKI